MRSFRIWLPAAFLASILAVGCEQGTEVGNPEIIMSARLSLVDSDASVSLPEMKLKVMGMVWTGSDIGACWNEPDGYLVDFADSASRLPQVKVRNGDWDWAEMVLRSSPGISGLPDSSSFEDWTNPRHVKLIKVTGADTLRFLFELPADLRINLMFNAPTIQSWRGPREILVQIRFDAGKWADGLGSNPGYRFRQDGKRARYVLLSPAENAAAYRIMKAGLPKAFIADYATIQ